MISSYIPVCELKSDSRSLDAVVSLDSCSPRTWNDFVLDVSKVRNYIDGCDCSCWIVHCENTYYFAVCLLALLQGGCKALVTANRQTEFIREIRKPEYGFLTDEPFENASLVPEILQKTCESVKFNSFDKNKAEMVMYTSGTTGEPKSVFKLFCQFENELHELVKTFGSDWLNREVRSTVNHHHIYGLLFTVLLPLATGLTFCSRRIEFPNELDSLRNRKMVIAASPAFLKRFAADIQDPLKFGVPPIVYSSGGPLPVDVAGKVSQLVNFWTIEVYGSTETGGIAYRQSKNGMEWTPFEVCKMSLSDNGCLNVQSSYILEPDGFTTGDLVEFLPDGRFLLKGRADSIVKIEEKRISLPEVEARLKSSGLVQDVRVVPMEGKRQYLAAAIVLNKDGNDKFAGVSKLEVNRFFRSHLAKFLENTVSPKKWRYLEELPQDTQGKIKTRDIQALFNVAENNNFHILKLHREMDSFVVKILFPLESDYYDGHFPEYKLLPAVVQVDVALKLANAFLGSSLNLKKIQRTKFMKPIFPDSPVVLKVSLDRLTNKISFSYSDVAVGMLSTGSFVMV